MELNIDVQGSWLHGGAVAMIIEPQLECSSFRHSWIMQENPLDDDDDCVFRKDNS